VSSVNVFVGLLWMIVGCGESFLALDESIFFLIYDLNIFV
jgi:hypothetical protein